MPGRVSIGWQTLPGTPRLMVVRGLRLCLESENAIGGSSNVKVRKKTEKLRKDEKPSDLSFFFS